MARPMLYTLEQLKEKVNDYFNYCDEACKPYTVKGLACFLNVHYDTLIDWQNADRVFIGMNKDEIEEFSETVKMAKQRIEAYAEEELHTARNPNGIIFSLKNNFGSYWKDKVEVNNTNTNKINVLEGLSTDEIKKLMGKTE